MNAIKELDEEIVRLERVISDLNNGVASMAYVRDKQDKRIQALESLIEDSMKVMRIYINVPEFSDLKSRWEALKPK